MFSLSKAVCVTQTAKKHNLKDENNSYLRATGEDPHE